MCFVRIDRFIILRLSIPTHREVFYGGTIAEFFYGAYWPLKGIYIYD